MPSPLWVIQHESPVDSETAEDAIRNPGHAQETDRNVEVDRAPERGEVLTDPDPRIGLTRHNVASRFHPHGDGKSAPWWAVLTPGWAKRQEQLSEQQAAQGYGPSREMAGEFGHGSVAWAEGIETNTTPALGQDYFIVAPHDLNYGDQSADMGDGVRPTEQSIGHTANAALARKNANDAALDRWWSTLQNG